jgi:Fur family iron response transcriptional regulator
MERADILLAFSRCGIQPTSQRIEVAGVLLEKAQHLSADQIINRLREKGSRVSKATVYNTLNLFGERGLVTEILVDPERRYYDSNTDKHHHFYNVDTGRLTDIPRDAIKVSHIPECPDGGALESIEVLVKVRNPGPDKSG